MKLTTSLLLLATSLSSLTSALAAPHKPITATPIPNAALPDRTSTDSVAPRPPRYATSPGQDLPPFPVPKSGAGGVSPAAFDFAYWVCEDVKWGGECIEMTHNAWNGECAVFPENWLRRISTLASKSPNQTCRFYTERHCAGYYIELVTPQEVDDLRNWGPGPDGADGMNDVVSSVKCWLPMPPKEWFDDLEVAR